MKDEDARRQEGDDFRILDLVKAILHRRAAVRVAIAVLVGCGVSVVTANEETEAGDLLKSAVARHWQPDRQHQQRKDGFQFSHGTEA